MLALSLTLTLVKRRRPSQAKTKYTTEKKHKDSLGKFFFFAAQTAEKKHENIEQLKNAEKNY